MSIKIKKTNEAEKPEMRLKPVKKHGNGPFSKLSPLRLVRAEALDISK